MAKLREIIDNVAEYIMGLPAGAEISIREIFNELYLKDGYTWMHKDTNVGWVCTNDECKTFLIKDSDLFDVLNEAEKIVNQQGIELDFSKWKDMCVGLPYNLEFDVVKK